MEDATETAAETLAAAERDCQGNDGINIGRQTVTASTDHLPEDQKRLLRWIYTVAKDQRWSFRDLERETGVSSTTFYRVWHNRYINPETKKPVPLDSLCKKLESFKAEYLCAHPFVREEENPFVETSVWDRVDWLCGKVTARRKMGFIYGESHIGKTRCLLERQRRNNHGLTAYFELPPSGGVQLMTKRLARSLHVLSETSFDKMLDLIVRAVDDEMLIIADQVHRIFYSYQHSSVMRCLDVLMYIHDTTNCPMVLCGTNVWRDQLREGQFKQYLKQLKRRGLYEIQLPSAAPMSDLIKIAAVYNLPPPDGDALPLVNAIARNDGLAMYFTRLQDAAEMAARKRERLAWSHFVRAVTIAERMAIEPRGA